MSLEHARRVLVHKALMSTPFRDNPGTSRLLGMEFAQTQRCDDITVDKCLCCWQMTYPCSLGREHEGACLELYEKTVWSNNTQVETCSGLLQCLTQTPVVLNRWRPALDSCELDLKTKLGGGCMENLTHQCLTSGDVLSISVVLNKWKYALDSCSA